MSAGTCRSCGAAVVWAEHERTGKTTPLDAAPTAEGTWHIETNLLGATVYRHGEAGGHTSHFATCPQRDGWRRPR